MFPAGRLGQPMDRQGYHFGHTVTRTHVARQPVDLLLRGLRTQLRLFRFVSIHTGAELPKNAWDDYQPTIRNIETKPRGSTVEKSPLHSLTGWVPKIPKNCPRKGTNISTRVGVFGCKDRFRLCPVLCPPATPTNCDASRHYPLKPAPVGQFIANRLNT
jgi:hypothetical protein